MTTNALKAKELEQRRQHDAETRRIQEEHNKRQDATNRRGQNFNLGTSAANFIGGRIDSARNTGMKALPLLLSALNDVEWYAQDEQIAKDTASLPWGYRNGIPLDLGQEIDPATPGIIAIDCLPSIGISENGISGVNTAARSIYSWVRHMNSGSANYEAVDLMQYLICLGSMYSMWGFATRLLGLAQSHSHDNAYFPKLAMIANTANYEAYASELANYRARLNVISLRISQAFAAPYDMGYFKRMLFLFSHIYKDNETDKSQIYMYRPAGYYTYNELGGGCKYNIIGSVPTPDDMIRILENMLNTLTESESANIMSGDIRKAYGEDRLWVLPTLDESYVVEPQFDQLVLDQMRNATVFRAQYTNLDITQDGGNLIFRPRIVTGASDYAAANNVVAVWGSSPRLLTVKNSSPDWKDVLESTRDMLFTGDVVTRSEEGNDVYDVYVETCGSELYLGFTIYIGATNEEGFTSWDESIIRGLDFAAKRGAAKLQSFSYAPAVTTGSTVDGVYRYAKAQNIDNWTIIDRATLRGMNDAVMLNMFHVKNNRP